MSEHAVMRRRLEALDEALEALRGWGTGESAGPIGVWSSELAVDAAPYATEGDASGVWLTAGALYQLLRDLRADVAEMAQAVEEHTAEHGAVEWEALD